LIRDILATITGNRPHDFHIDDAFMKHLRPPLPAAGKQKVRHMKKPRALIADDHALLAEGIASVLRPTCDVIGICVNGRQLLEESARLCPDIIIFDIGMPEMNGLEAAKRIHETQPSIILVCVTQQITLPYLRAAFQAGAIGYVAKQAASTELEMAISRAVRGHRFITPFLEEAYEDSLLSRPNLLAKNAGEPLTPRQREVLQLLAEGKQNKEIATTLRVSAKTVEFHRAAIMDTLGLRSTAELTRYAVAHGLTHL
jgi:DNA-binding NarL/FixJ family response regulator